MLANKKTSLKGRNWTIGVCVLATLAAVTLTAQAAEKIVDVQASVVHPERQPMVQPVEQGMGSGQSIQTISFKKDMPIKDALNMLGQMYEKNIVPSAKVDGIVTVSNLYDVTFEEALQAILGTHKYEIRGNFIKIYTNEEFMADKSRLEHAIITLYYISSTEAEKLATPLISEFGRLGVTTAAPESSEAGMGADSLAIHDRLVVSDYPEIVQGIREMLAEVDVRPMQVLIEVTVMKADLTEDLQFGIDWSNVPGLDVSLTQSGISSQSTTGILAGGLSANISIDSFSAFVRANEGVSDITLVANPKILALNKQTGKLIIGSEEGYQSVTNSNADGATQQIEFLESGTILEFRPFIGKDGMIRMEIRPEQSSSYFTSGIPNKSTTNILTNVMVKDGQTIVLGGLFQEETNLGRTQTPILGDVPIAGNLFKNIDDSSERTELIVLITPHIINDPEQADGADRLEDVYRLAHGARQNIHWMSRARIAESHYFKAVKAYTAGDYTTALSALDKPYVFKPRNDLDFIRLRESIIRETQPEMVDQIERVMLMNLEKEESGKWLRR